MMPSLCETCENVRAVCTARSRFLLCGLSVTDAAYPKYPPQPVVRCDGHRPSSPAAEGDSGVGAKPVDGRCDPERPATDVLPLFHEPHFTFRFAEDRIIPRFHLEGIESGRRVSVYRIDPGTGERLSLIAEATAGEGGWVEVPTPIIVRAGEAFVAVPEPGV
jgi:hypothetical protein